MSQLMTKTLGGLYNGVSQQAQTMRLETQHSEQVNFDSTIVDGLYKRPGTRWSTKILTEYANTGTYWSSIVRDSDEAYVFMITPDGYIHVWDKDGEPREVIYGYMNFADYTYTVNNDVRTNYLGHQPLPARQLFDTLSVGDYTFISRSDTTPTMLDDVYDGTGSHTETVVESLMSYSEPREGTTTTSSTAADGTVTTITKTTEITSISEGDSSKKYFYDVTTITTTSYVGGVSGKYQSFSRLEKDIQDGKFTSTIGDIIHITGDPDDSDAEYWVRYAEGDVWIECPCPGTKTALNRWTLPHALVRAPDGRFVFTPLEWGQRLVGGDKTNMVPSFIGSKITQMFFYRNRLGFLTPTSLVMSRPGDYFELFSTTSLEVLDSDPIDASANTRQVTNLHKTEVMGRKLILYSDRQQFTVHSNDDPMTPNTIQIDPGTTYETNGNSQTATCGASAFFISPKKHYVDLMEYENMLGEEIKDASIVTSHCPDYIPNGFISIVSSPADNMLIMHSDARPNSLWIYRSQMVQDTKAQSAFSEWRFHDDIEGITMINSDLVMLQKIDGGLAMTKMSLEGIPDYNLGWHISLDRGVTVQSHTFDEASKTSLVTMPYNWHLDTVVIDASTGRSVPNFESAPGGLKLHGVDSTGQYMVGLKIDARVTLSPWYIKTAQGSAIIDGRLQVRNISIQYQDTGYFQVEIQNEGRDARVEEWTNNIIGKMRYGGTQLFDGKFKTGVRGRNTTTTIKIKSPSYLPVKIAAVGYEGMFVQRASAL